MNTHGCPSWRNVLAHQRGLRRRITWQVLVILCLVALCQDPVLAETRHDDNAESGASQFLTGASCLVVGVPYTAFKLTFAGLGMIVGTFAYALSGGDEHAAQKVWDASLRGTYIITPDHLKGVKRIAFVGSSQE